MLCLSRIREIESIGPK